MKLKINFHLHTADDPRDNVKYSAYEAIDRARELGFDVLAITCHFRHVVSRAYIDYAESRKILLIPGIEIRIEGRDVIILNSDKEAESLKTFDDLAGYREKNPHIFILAPHPFVSNIGGQVSLNGKLEKYIKLFDAIELSVISNHIIDFNERAVAVAEKHNKPLLATSDCHFLSDLGRGYAIIETEERTIESVFGAIRDGRVENQLEPMGLLDMVRFKTIGEIGRIVKFFQ